LKCIKIINWSQLNHLSQLKPSDKDLGRIPCFLLPGGAVVGLLAR